MFYQERTQNGMVILNASKREDDNLKSVKVNVRSAWNLSGRIRHYITCELYIERQIESVRSPKWKKDVLEREY